MLVLTNHNNNNNNKRSKEITDANPGASAKEILKLRRAFQMKAALEAQKNKGRDGKDSSPSLSSPRENESRTVSSANAKDKDTSLPLLHLGTVKPTAPLSMNAEPKSDETVEKGSNPSLRSIMSADAMAIRMRNQALIDKQNKLIADAHAQCERATAEAHTQMKEASLSYGKAIDQQLQTLQESTIAEDTLNEEMVLASQAHRDRLKEMRAHPPLNMDEDRLHLQIRCAAAEEKAESIQEKLRSLQEH